MGYREITRRVRVRHNVKELKQDMFLSTRASNSLRKTGSTSAFAQASDVFELRTTTGRELFSYLFIHGQFISLKVYIVT